MSFRCRGRSGPSFTSPARTCTRFISRPARAVSFAASLRSDTPRNVPRSVGPVQVSPSKEYALSLDRTDTATAVRGRGSISRWSIEHPWIVTAFYLGVAILGVLVIFFHMPRRMMPYVESPIVGVVSMMPGLSAEEMEIYFSKPIEERMVDLKNVKFVCS